MVCHPAPPRLPGDGRDVKMERLRLHAESSLLECRTVRGMLGDAEAVIDALLLDDGMCD